MARTTSSAIGEIIDVDTGDSLTPFIEAANNLVTQCCGDVVAYDAAMLELIERWLSAHFYTVLRMRAESEKAGPVSEKKQSAVGLGFDTSHYGQMAMRLDWNGGLSALNEQAKKGGRRTAGVTWLGTDIENELET